MELLLRETRELLRVRPGVVIVEDVRGLVLANAGIDASNVSAVEDKLLLLPEDPDASAAGLRAALHEATGVVPAVLVIGSIGRAWRQGTVGTAIGIAGMQGLVDLRTPRHAWPPAPDDGGGLCRRTGSGRLARHGREACARQRWQRSLIRRSIAS